VWVEQEAVREQKNKTNKKNQLFVSQLALCGSVSLGSVLY
jgi:hypothetical protein